MWYFLSIRKNISHVISTNNFYFVWNVPFEEVVELEVASLNKWKQGILHHESNSDKELDEFTKLIGDERGFLHVEPTFSYIVEFGFDDLY